MLYTNITNLKWSKVDHLLLIIIVFSYVNFSQAFNLESAYGLEMLSVSSDWIDSDLMSFAFFYNRGHPFTVCKSRYVNSWLGTSLKEVLEGCVRLYVFLVHRAYTSPVSFENA